MFDSITGSSSALLNAVVIGATNVLSTFVGLVLVDRWGRRPLLVQGGLQMMCSQVGAAHEATPEAGASGQRGGRALAATREHMPMLSVRSCPSAPADRHSRLAGPLLPG